MQELINQETISALSKSKKIIILRIIISALIAVGIIILLLFLTNRKIRFVMAVVLAIVLTIEASFILYTLITSLIPLNNYQKLCKSSLNGNKYESNVEVISISENDRHVKGISVREIKVKDLQEDKEYAFYIESNNDISSIAIGNKYRFITYQSIVVKYESL